MSPQGDLGAVFRVGSVVMWRVGFALLSSCLVGCGATRHSDGVDGLDTAAGGAPGDEPPTVSIELPVVVSRSVERDEAGKLLLGDPEPIDEAVTCVTERRDAFAIFEPYEPLDDPICVTTPKGEVPHLSEVPANSDLTLTISKQGYLPVAQTLRVEDFDLLMRPDYDFMRTVLFDGDQADWFVPAPGETGNEEPDDTWGRLTLEVGMVGLFSNPPGDPGQFVSLVGSTFFVARDLDVSITGENSGSTADFDFEGSPLLASTRAGTYRALAIHPRAPCDPFGTPYAYTPWGLGTDAFGELELRILPGHVTTLFSMCVCLPPSKNAVALDVPSCSFEEGEP